MNGHKMPESAECRHFHITMRLCLALRITNCHFKNYSLSLTKHFPKSKRDLSSDFGLFPTPIITIFLLTEGLHT